jgi:uncharacterized protein YpmS
MKKCINGLIIVSLSSLTLVLTSKPAETCCSNSRPSKSEKKDKGTNTLTQINNFPNSYIEEKAIIELLRRNLLHTKNIKK